ncbi:hypothetical protein HDK64DRAFT_76570 [Phyllosticta capitalensis]
MGGAYKYRGLGLLFLRRSHKLPATCLSPALIFAKQSDVISRHPQLSLRSPARRSKRVRLLARQFDQRSSESHPSPIRLNTRPLSPRRHISRAWSRSSRPRACRASTSCVTKTTRRRCCWRASWWRLRKTGWSLLRRSTSSWQRRVGRCGGWWSFACGWGWMAVACVKEQLLRTELDLTVAEIVAAERLLIVVLPELLSHIGFFLCILFSCLEAVEGPLCW